jgi:hypothetical protein
MSALSKQASNRMLEPRLILLTGAPLSASFLVVATQETFRGLHADAWGHGHFEFKRMVERRGIQ